MRSDEPTTTGELVKAVLFPGTLREWYAGMALPGIVANPSNGEWSEARIATYAFQLANAMITQREAQP